MPQSRYEALIGQALIDLDDDPFLRGKKHRPDCRTSCSSIIRPAAGVSKVRGIFVGNNVEHNAVLAGQVKGETTLPNYASNAFIRDELSNVWLKVSVVNDAVMFVNRGVIVCKVYE